MAVSEQQRQKKLAKKKQKRVGIVKKLAPAIKKAKPYCEHPIHECLIPNDLFTTGLGELVVTRRTPNNDIAMSVFVVDVFCLGIKDSLFTVMPESDYERNKNRMLEAAGNRSFEKLEPSCAKKLLDGVIAYAKDLGFPPHPNHKNALELFGDIDTSECSVKYAYGNDGRPFYIRGPYESLAEMQRILAVLTRKCGVGGFDTSLSLLDNEEIENNI